MPVEQTTNPQLVSISGFANKQVSTGMLRINMLIEGGLGFPPEEELDPILLQLFSAVGAVGWQGGVTKTFTSAHTILADAIAPPEPAAEPTPEPAPEEVPDASS